MIESQSMKKQFKKVVYVVLSNREDGTTIFLTPRRATGSMYVYRAITSPDFADARIFATKSAAKNSANRFFTLEGDEFEVREVTVTLEF